MNISILAVGTMGDIRPCIMLSRRLIKQGHKTTLLADEKFKQSVEAEGIGFAAFPLDASEILKLALNPDTNAFKLLNDMNSYAGENLDEMEKIMTAYFKDSDIILYTSSSSSMAVYIAEYYKIPYARINYYPDADSTNYLPPICPKLPLPPITNYLYHRIANTLYFYFSNKIYSRSLKPWIKKYGLNLKGYPFKRSDGQPLDHIMAFSEAIVARPKQYKENMHITGYLFEDIINLSDYQPDEKLVSFIESGETPIYIGFGSMTEGGFDELLNITLDALKITGHRAIISKGWGNLSADNLPDNVHIIDYCPHDWLFPRVSAVVHHGGAGTTAAAFRVGKPSLIIAFGADQGYWGNCVHKLGCGPKYLKRKNLKAKALAKAIMELDSEEMKLNAKKIAAKLALEDGVGNACTVIEQIAQRGWNN